MPTLNLRPPTGEVPWPITLLEGGEKAGKTYEGIRFSGDDRIQHMWAMDLGEGSLDEYRDIPGADFLVIQHDGTWPSIIGQMEAAVERSIEVEEAGELAALLIDSGSAEWEMLTTWVYSRARKTDSNKAILARNPDAEIKAPRNMWNDANDRHRAFMSACRRFRGPVIITARGKWVSATGDNGQPKRDGSKEYRVEGQQNLGFDVNAWVRLSRDDAPTIVGLRHWKYGIRPGRDPQKVIEDFSLEWLIFDLMGCRPGVTKARQQVDLDADQLMPHEIAPAPDAAADAPAAEQRQPTPIRTEAVGPNAAAREQRSLAQKAADGVRSLLAAASAADATQLAGYAAQSQAKNVDVSGFLKGEDVARRNLDLADDRRITLAQLGKLVETFWGQRGVSPSLDAEPADVSTQPAAEAELAAAQAALDTLADELGARTVDASAAPAGPPAEVAEAIRDHKDLERELRNVS